MLHLPRNTVLAAILFAGTLPLPAAETPPAKGDAPGPIAFKDASEEMGIVNFQKITKPEWPTCPADEEHHYIQWPFNLCTGDFNNDGTPDLFCGQHGDPGSGFSHLFLLDPKTRLFAIHRGDKVVRPGKSRGAYISGVVDANDDGLLDIVISDGDTTASLLVNVSKDGVPAFEKRPFSSSSALAFADLDHDGGLDTVVDRMGVYKGVGTEKEKEVKVGDFQFYGRGHPHLILADSDGDGNDDVIYADVTGNLGKPGNKDLLRLFMNRGNMRFEETTADAGLSKGCSGQIAVGDLDSDGDLDIVAMGAVNTDNPDGNLKIYLNDGKARFEDVTAKSNLAPLPKYVNGFEFNMRCTMSLVDLDNDGFQDLVCRNYGFYRNKGDGTFEEFRPILSASQGNSIVAPADFNDDGRIDLAFLTLSDPQVPVRIFRNETQTANRWLKLVLRQKEKNLFAIGAKIYAYKAGMLGDAKGKVAMREVMTGSMNMADFSPLHVGVGGNEKVDLRVVFPTGKVVEKRGVATKQILRIEDSEATESR